MFACSRQPKWILYVSVFRILFIYRFFLIKSEFLMEFVSIPEEEEREKYVS